MTYFVTALSNDRAQIILETLQTSDAHVADFVADHWLGLGYKVVRRVEG